MALSGVIPMANCSLTSPGVWSYFLEKDGDMMFEDLKKFALNQPEKVLGGTVDTPNEPPPAE